MPPDDDSFRGLIRNFWHSSISLNAMHLVAALEMFDYFAICARWHCSFRLR